MCYCSFFRYGSVRSVLMKKGMRVVPGWKTTCMVKREEKKQGDMQIYSKNRLTDGVCDE